MAGKRKSSSRYAIIGVILAVLGCIGTAGLGIMRGMVGVGLYQPTRPELLTQALAISVGILIVGLAVFSILNPGGVRRFLAGRQARYGSNALIMSVAFLGILVIVNWLVYQYPQKLDWSEGKKYTLAPESLQALEALPGKVRATAFFTQQYGSETALTLMDNFKTASDGKFDYELVDPNANPVLARQAGITADGQIVLTLGESKEIVSYADENSVTQAMIRLISPQSRAVYFLTGHGEPAIEASEGTSMSRARETLESKNYTVQELRLATGNKVPEDARAIIIAGATDPLLPQELSLLRSYLDAGGALLVLAGPAPFTVAPTGTATPTDSATPVAEQPDPLNDYLESEWAIAVEDTVVIDPDSLQPLMAVAASYSATAPITSKARSYTVMPEARSLSMPETPPSDISLTGLIYSSERSWGEMDIESLASQEVGFDQGADIPGPVLLAVSGENSKTSGRIVVFGDAEFATNDLFNSYSNGEIFTNAVDWAAQEEDLINITPRDTVEREFVPPPQPYFILILVFAALVLPGLVLLAGVSSWLSRRRRG